jgi:hypothetical protein
MAGKIIMLYNVEEYFRGVKFKVHGPFEGEWQAQNFVDTRTPEDGVEYLVVEL